MFECELQGIMRHYHYKLEISESGMPQIVEYYTDTISREPGMELPVLPPIGTKVFNPRYPNMDDCIVKNIVLTTRGKYIIQTNALLNQCWSGGEKENVEKAYEEALTKYLQARNKKLADDCATVWKSLESLDVESLNDKTKLMLHDIKFNVEQSSDRCEVLQQHLNYFVQILDSVLCDDGSTNDTVHTLSNIINILKNIIRYENLMIV